MKKFVSLSTGIRIEYVEQGPAETDGVPVIFLHGVTDSWRSFEAVLPLLPPHIHAFALSQRGHGDSSLPTSGYRLADMSADLLGFFDAMGLRTAILVGHSMGASVAQRFVIDHPDRVERLALMGAFATFDDPGLVDFVASSIVPVTDPIAASFAREWQLSTLARPMSAAHLDAVVSETLKVPARVWRDAFDGFLKTPDFTSELTEVSVPVLLMWGDHDSYALRAAQDRLREVMPKAQFIAYEGSGHAFHWEDPEQFTKDLVPFLTSRTGPTRRVPEEVSRVAGIAR
jgi:non-heme chloroperoxidase